MNVWSFISEKQAASIPVMLLYVLESLGSSPGRQGFAMAVSADGDFKGTIGGGIMEHKFVEMAKVRLMEGTEQESNIYKQVHDKSAASNQSGMICSGEQTIFIYRVKQNDKVSIEKICYTLAANKNAGLQLSEAGIVFLPTVPEKNYALARTENDFIFVEKIGYKNELHIIGGGHCAFAFSKLMRGMDFYIRLYEQRAGLNTMEQNEYAHEKIVVDHYSTLGNLVKSGPNVYVVIMTFGYRTDDIALRALLGKSFAYIGMLGSKKKVEKMFTEYREANISDELLRQICSPIGIQIKSETAEEIAVSIAAEIIEVKNRRQVVS